MPGGRIDYRVELVTPSVEIGTVRVPPNVVSKSKELHDTSGEVTMQSPIARKFNHCVNRSPAVTEAAINLIGTTARRGGRNDGDATR